MANKVVFRQGTKASYLALQTKDDSTLYFCTDTRELFRGAELYTGGVRYVSDYNHLPVFAAAAEAVIYICLDSSAGYVLSAERNKWTQVFAGAEYSLTQAIDPYNHVTAYRLTKNGVNVGAPINIPNPCINGVALEGELTSEDLGIGMSYIHTQSVASDVWTITHGLGKYPSVTVVDSAGTVVMGDVQYLSDESLTVSFRGAFSGMAYLN